MMMVFMQRMLILFLCVALVGCESVVLSLCNTGVMVELGEVS